MRTIIAVLMLAGIAAAQQTETTALTHATVIDGTGAAPMVNSTVLIRNGRIIAVYPAGSRSTAAGAQTEDLTGKWIIPGLIDAHVHIANGGGDLARYRDLLGRLLLDGVTGLRDMAGDARILGYLARESRLDSPGWPDIYYSALMAGPTFFFEDARVPGAARGIVLGGAPWMRAVDETTDLRMAVAEAKGTGATGVKLYANLSAALVKAIAAEAHRQGLLVWTHATVFPAKPSDAIAAGANTVSHTAYLIWEAEPHVPSDYRSRAFGDFTRIRPDDPKITGLFEQMKEHGTILDATLRVFEQEIEHSPDAVGKGILPWIYAVTREAHQAGVLVDAGTDSQGLVSAKQPGSAPSVLEEMGLLVENCGFTPVEAIQAATQVSAMAAGQSAERGTVGVGKAADLVVLSADPAADIHNVRKIVEVFKDGKVFRPAQKP
ncbi:MAG TPA: amidohydrolase family protein [Bryobacteraceae bacterium]|nr:amidohydrolase family protein [Bryobacteraceae bacterium]